MKLNKNTLEVKTQTLIKYYPLLKHNKEYLKDLETTYSMYLVFIRRNALTNTAEKEIMHFMAENYFKELYK